MKIYKDINQGSPEWFEIRVGKVTASHAQAIGNNGKGLDTYLLEVVSEMFSSSEKEHRRFIIKIGPRHAPGPFPQLSGNTGQLICLTYRQSLQTIPCMRRLFPLLSSLLSPCP